MRRLLRTTTLAACLAATSAGAAAQPAMQGDIVLSALLGNPGLFKLSPGASGITTLVPGPQLNCVMTNWGNGSMLAIDTSDRLLQITTIGAVTTLAVLPSGANSAMAPNQTNEVSVASLSSVTGGVYNVQNDGTGLSTLRTFAPLNGICRSERDGQLYGVSFDPARVYRIYATTGSVRTISTLTSETGTGICYMPDQDRFVVSSGKGRLVFLSSTGTALFSAATPAFCNAVTYDHKRRELVAATNAGHVTRLTTSGTVIATRTLAGTVFTGVDICDDRNLSITATGVRGSSVAVRGRFARSQSKAYCLALSLGLRPGLTYRASGRYQHATPDYMFFLTLCGSLPFWTQGFAGTTAGDGTFNASFTIPRGISRFQMLYVVGVAINGAFPDGLDLGNVEAIDVQ